MYFFINRVKLVTRTRTTTVIFGRREYDFVHLLEYQYCLLASQCGYLQVLCIEKNKKHSICKVCNFVLSKEK
jgi:hypothetical protein